MIPLTKSYKFRDNSINYKLRKKPQNRERKMPRGQKQTSSPTAGGGVTLGTNSPSLASVLKFEGIAARPEKV